MKIILAALVSSALAQNALPKQLGHFLPGTSQATLNVSSSNSRVGLPTGGAVLVYNVGTATAHFTLGDSNVVDNPTGVFPDFKLDPGCFIAVAEGNATSLAAAAPAGSTTLDLFGGNGLPAKGCAK